MKILKIIAVMLAIAMLISCDSTAEDSEEEIVKSEGQIILNYPLFDGEKIIENAEVVINDGVITSVSESESVSSEYFLMPGFIDAHTHMKTEEEIKSMLKNGVTATCDVAASASLIENSKQFAIVSSAGMAMVTVNGKAYVNKAIENGAAYIKVLLMEPNLMLKSVLKDICNTAHENGLKVAVHAVSVKAVQMAVNCGADILIHVPMKEEFPKELAKTIAEKGIVVAPTLVMMKAFSESNRNGYEPKHYQNAENAVRLLHEYGVEILVSTDANDGSFAPFVEHGASIHREMQLLVEAGLTPCEVLAGATSKVAKVFDIKDLGSINSGKRAVLLLIEGRPDKDIKDTSKIKQIWIDGEPLL